MNYVTLFIIIIIYFTVEKTVKYIIIRLNEKNEMLGAGNKIIPLYDRKIKNLTRF